MARAKKTVKVRQAYQSPQQVAIKSLWQRSGFRAKMTAQSRALMKSNWRDPKFRKKTTGAIRAMWADPRKRAQLQRAIREGRERARLERGE